MSIEITQATDAKTLFKMGTVLTDSLGRKIKIKKPGRLARLKLAEALGAVADNDRYFRLIEPITYVCEIDGLAFDIGMTKREAEAAYDRLGEEGEEAIAKFFLEHLEEFSEKKEEIVGKEQLKK